MPIKRLERTRRAYDPSPRLVFSVPENPRTWSDLLIVTDTGFTANVIEGDHHFDTGRDPGDEDPHEP